VATVSGMLGNTAYDGFSATAITVLDRRSAVIGQVPLMIVMIFCTVSGLTIIVTP